MRIVNLRVSHFRGINSLDWDLNGHTICLIGAGDSTKSTILNAIELSLTPNRNITFDDTDFYNSDTSRPICIEITVSEIPEELLSDKKFGYMIKGWSEACGIKDEPENEDIPVLTIRLSVDETLEPNWKIVNNRQPEGAYISAYDRSKFGMLSIHNFLEKQLTWGAGTVLTQLMDDSEDIYSVLTAARRFAKSSLDLETIPIVTKSAKNAELVGKRLGIKPKTEIGFVPNIDFKYTKMGTSILSLYDGSIPMRQVGLGTSRLFIIGLQHEAKKRSSITLVDEIEYGLEPHRVRRLLRVIREGPSLLKEDKNTDIDNNDNKNQVIISTHSPVVVSELEPTEIRIVHSIEGQTYIKKPDAIIRPLIRSNPEAFLSRKVIICEGKTEIGLCRAFDKWWSDDCFPFSYSGVALADGQGNTKGPMLAIELSKLNYKTVYFGDSDKPLNPNGDELMKNGVSIVLWPDGVATEERIAFDLPWAGFIEMVCLAMKEFGEEHVLGKIANALCIDVNSLSKNPHEWASKFSSDSEIRNVFANIAKNNKPGWYKRVDTAEQLGKIIIKNWANIEKKPLGLGINQLKECVYE